MKHTYIQKFIIPPPPATPPHPIYIYIILEIYKQEYHTFICFEIHVCISNIYTYILKNMLTYKCTCWAVGLICQRFPAW